MSSKSKHGSPSPGIHKDWRAWTVVGLMLVAIVVYVLSMDESIVPGQPDGPALPAEAAE